MDNQQRLILLTRSWNALLFLLPQAARNMREVLRVARISIPDDAPAEEKALFAQQEAVLSEFYKAMYVMRNGGWEGAHERLQELIAECDGLRAKLEREFEDPLTKESLCGLDVQTPAAEDAKAKAERLAHLLQ